MEFLKVLGGNALVFWGIGFLFKIGGKLLKLLLIIGIIMLILGYIS